MEPLIVLTLIHGITAILAGSLALYVWQRRWLAPGATSLVLLMAGLSEWAFFAGIDFLITNPDLKIWTSKLTYLGIVVTGPAWIQFTFQYSGNHHLLTPGVKASLWIIPVIVLTAAFTNEYHKLLWPEVTQVSPKLIRYGHGPIFYLNICYIYVAFLVGTTFLMRYLFWMPNLYRKQSWSLLIGVMIPIMTSIVYITGNSPIPEIDFTPMTLTITGIFIIWAIYRFRLLDIIPIAYEVLFSAQPDGVLVVDSQSRLVNLNPAAWKLLAVSNDMIGQPIENILPDWRRWMSASEGISSSEKGHLIQAADGKEWIDVRINPLCKQNEVPAGHMVLLLNVTSQVESDRALRDAKETWERTFNAVPDLVCLLDPTFRIMRMNHAFQDRLKSVPASVAEYFGFGSEKHSEGTVKPEVTLFDPEKFFRGEAEHPLLEGTFLVTSTPLRDAENQIYGIVQVAHDISDLKEAEQQRLEMERRMQQTQKLESLGILAGGIAHDFNNLLQAILGNIDLCLEELPADSSLHSRLAQALKASLRASDICRQMLAYSGRGRFIVQPLNLDSIIEDMKGMLMVSIPKKVELVIHPSHEAPWVEGDETQLRQVIMNLILNAADAIGEESGQIQVSTEILHLDENNPLPLFHKGELPEGRCVSLEVKDTGCGMSEETQRRMFEPFFTTKFTGRGLGLAAVLGIVHGHKGSIQVRSVENCGSSFVVLLPVTPTPAITQEKSAGGDATFFHNGTILVVDDEETILEIGARLLSGMGFDVLVAKDGASGVEIFRREHQHIRCILLDLTMPKMDGEEVLVEIRRTDPVVPVILSSGFNEEEISSRFRGMGISGFLQKPYRLKDLKEMINMVLGPCRSHAD